MCFSWEQALDKLPTEEIIMKMKRCRNLLAGLVVTAACISASADSAIDEKTIAALDSEYQLAVKNNDAGTMARILSDDFILIWGTGQTFAKTDLLSKARAKEIVYEQNEDTNKTVRVWGNTAVLTSKLWAKGVDGGKSFDWHVWFSDTYVRTPSGWRYVNGFASLPLEFLPPKPAVAK
jgi:ketosteroid isomerase-like protein